MFGWKLEWRPSTIGGAKLDASGRGMPYGPPDGTAFIPGDPTVQSTPLGTITSRCLGDGAAAALAAAVEAAVEALPAAGSRHRSDRERLDERLARLGVGGRARVRPRFVDMPFGGGSDG